MIRGLASEAVSLIFKNRILEEDGIIVIETDQEERILNEIQEYKDKIYKIRKYGRVKLIFLRRE